MGIFDELKGETPIKKGVQGLIWINMLVEYDTLGNAKVLRSFANPAKESTIKRFKPVKEKVEKIEIIEDTKKTNLF